MIRILLVMSRELDRAAVAALLNTQEDFRVVAGAPRDTGPGSGVRRRHDILVLDIGLEGRSGKPASVRELIERFAGERILALAPHSDEECAVLNTFRAAGDLRRGDRTDTCTMTALSAGALGVLKRDASAVKLFQAVRSVAAGRPWLETSDVLQVLDQLRVPSRPAHITIREQRIAGLIGAGHSNGEISQILLIGEPTVKKHVGHLLHKLGLKDRLQLGIYVTRHPILFSEGSPKEASREGDIGR